MVFWLGLLGRNGGGRSDESILGAMVDRALRRGSGGGSRFGCWCYGLVGAQGVHGLVVHRAGRLYGCDQMLD